MSQRPESQRPPPTETRVKTTCLFCLTPVLCQPDESLDPESPEGKRRNEIIKTFCFHAQLSAKKVPNECTYEAFPFCTTCEEKVVDVWENDNVIKAATAQISKSMGLIERTVADAELLKPRLTESTPTSSKKFEGLSEKILDDYKNKLQLKQKLRENLLMGTTGFELLPQSSTNVIVQDDKLRVEFRKLAKTKNTARPAQANQSTSRCHPVASSSQSGQGPSSISSPFQRSASPQKNLPGHSQALVRASPQANTVRSSEASQAPPLCHVNYDERSSTLHIRTTSSFMSPVKQEPLETEERESLAPTSGTFGKRKRRYFILGIEVNRLMDRNTRLPYIQCSICKYVIANNNTTNPTPHQIMSSHMQDKHLGKRKRAVVTGSPTSSTSSNTRNKQYTCKVCKKSFGGRPALLDHEAGHKKDSFTPKANRLVSGSPKPSTYHSQNLTCDICGRPVKGTMANLMAHKFSHKNNEEREIAIAANEPGSGNRKLLTPNSCSSKKKTLKYPGIRNTTRKVNRSRSSVVSTSQTKYKDIEKESGIQCQICFRKFSRKCHLTLHMQGHLRRSQTSTVTPLKKSTELEKPHNEGKGREGECAPELSQPTDEVNGESDASNNVSSLTVDPPPVAEPVRQPTCRNIPES